MKIIRTAVHGFEAAVAAVTRIPDTADSATVDTVREIVAEVQAKGDAALLALSRKFDCATLTRLEVTPAEWAAAVEQVPQSSRAPLKRAAAEVRSFHQYQVRSSWMKNEPARLTGQLIRPLQRVGIYIPGGTAIYPSSALMVAIPAAVAGVPEIIMCTPSSETGDVNPLVLYAARLAGVSRIFKVGGAQAVAAMAFGTQTIPRVDKVAGPGNAYVTAAKRLLWGIVDVDMLAGPSEVCIVADDSARPEYAVADMIAQAEHDVHTAAYLFTTSEAVAERATNEISNQLTDLPRGDMVRQSFDARGAIVITTSLDEAYTLVNHCAPEHLALMVQNPFAALPYIHNAGAILIGDCSPQTLGDYMAGPSHTLPTSGTARFSSPLNVDTFLKKSSIISYQPAGLYAVSDDLCTLARLEGFEAHARAVEIRRERDAPERMGTELNG